MTEQKALSKNILKVELSDRLVQSKVEYFVLSFEVLLSASEDNEQIEATVEVREGFNEDAELFAHANLDTLQFDSDLDDLNVKAAVTERIQELLEAEGYEVSGSSVGHVESKENQALKHLRAVLRYAESQVCLHECTHRGGAIWEICDACGARWADDEGGKPAAAGELPRVLREAGDFLAAIEKCANDRA